MISKYRIGLVGSGNMASAIVGGLIAAGVVPVDQIRATDLDATRRRTLTQSYGIHTSADNSELVSWADVVLLATKPQVLPSVLPELSQVWSGDKVLISMLAGIPTQTLQAGLPAGARVVRVMPNTAVQVRAGATAVAGGSSARAEDVEVAQALFNAVGRTVLVAESGMNAVTGLSGSGPAYVFAVLQALADGGVKMGLPRTVAQELAAQTLYGSAKMCLETGLHPAVLRDMVTSPGGTTVYGLHILEERGLHGILMSAVEAATERAKALG